MALASPLMVRLSSLLQRVTWISLVSICAAILQFWCRTTITDWRHLLFVAVFRSTLFLVLFFFWFVFVDHDQNIDLFCQLHPPSPLLLVDTEYHQFIILFTCTLNGNYSMWLWKSLRDYFFSIVAPLSLENDPMSRAILEWPKTHAKSITVHQQIMIETCASRWLNRSRRMPCGKSTIWVTQFYHYQSYHAHQQYVYPTLFCRE